MKNLKSILAIAPLVLFTGTIFAQQVFDAGKKNDLINHDNLVEDTRQLARYIEESHPEPYQDFGGKISFNRELQGILLSISPAGMTKSEYYKIIMPFVARIGDMHTGFINSGSSKPNSPGLPLQFKIVGKDLVVTGVSSDKDKQLLGSRLQSIEGIPLTGLRTRQTRLRGIENEYGELVFLTISLKTANGIKNLIPEWNNPEKIAEVLKLTSGKNNAVSYQMGAAPTENPLSFASKIKKPSMESSDVAFNFLDDRKENALLIISNMERYREASESWFSSGMKEAAELTGIAYKYFNKTDVPADKDLLLKGIPSATETFMALVSEMKSAHTKNLIVDLRENTGGNSMMKEMLVYFLFGKKGLIKMNQGYQVIKYSDLYFESFSSGSLALINKLQPIILNKDDYDFSSERAFKDNYSDLSEIEAELIKSPTFWDVYKTGRFDNPAINLENIIVLCSPFTTSSGFNLLTALTEKGAMVAGTPSAQPGNNFGDVLFFQLKNSEIRGYVSYKQNITFPNDPVKGKCLMPDYLLTYEKFAEYKFDPDAEIIFAQEILKTLRVK
ncbi:MAG: S41 family peptidase [Bacteroidales bacterium]